MLSFYFPRVSPLERSQTPSCNSGLFFIIYSRFLFSKIPGRAVTNNNNTNVHTCIRLGTYIHTYIHIRTEKRKRNEPGELLRSPGNSSNLCNFVSKSGKYFATIRCLCFDGIRGIKAGETFDRRNTVADYR